MCLWLPSRLSALFLFCCHIDCGAVSGGSYKFVRVSNVADWIERNACALSEKREELLFCPELVCPADARLLGYPWAVLQDGTTSVTGLRGFNPVNVTQWPPPGTPLWRNTTTNVSITAYDTAGRRAECTWYVFVAPLVKLGTMTMPLASLPGSTYTKTGRFQRDNKVISGRIYKMSGRTSDKLRGSGSSVQARLGGGSGKQTGRALIFNESQTSDEIEVPDVPIQFDRSDESDVKLSVRVVRNARRNSVTYDVFGQVQDYLFV
jgi:hypothetical protein